MAAVSTTTATEDRALQFLGEGHSLEVTAAACGVSVSRISQLLADEEFSGKVAARRYDSLLKKGKRAEAYENIEDELLTRLKGSLAMIFDPMKIARLLQVISLSKPKINVLPTDLPQAQQVVPLTIPVFIAQRFTTNIYNQVVEIHGTSPEDSSSQTLVTIQSGQLQKLSAARRGKENERLTFENSARTPDLNLGSQTSSI